MQKLLSNICLGSDPELFVQDIKTGEFIPSLDLIGGSKYLPRASSKEGFFLQEDNVLVEFNIPPARTMQEFLRNIQTGMETFKEFLPEDKYKVAIASSYNFKESQLTDPRAFEFGCEPDRNAWKGGEYNPRPAEPIDGLRSAGGHIHIGYDLNADTVDEDTMAIIERSDVNRQLIKWCDLFLGVPSMLMDNDLKRRTLYGKAGAYRDKAYGVEYRTLSSFWLKTDAMIEWAYAQTMRAVDKVSNLELLDNSIVDKVEAAINYNDKRSIEQLMLEYKLQAA